ncbi:TLD domain-containing protein 2 isoform X2 [Embiotoca jacksoni]|uniref:TLD domain-containing protein 2 isoform X2 n=1 Tax=Embiotoca jacksoni TaxID=100190 RepID=UPI003704632D
MWCNRVQGLTEKSRAMKLLPENTKVLYFASDHVEPYVVIITVKDSKRRRSLCNSENSEAEEHEYHGEAEYVVPVLSDHSQLLEDHHLKRLAAHMPARTQGYQWQLVYSTAVHGSSLKTLYRNMAGLDSPVLLVIKDMHKKVFGAFSSDPFRVSKYCYGTGETFLFSFSPDFKAYRWTGENSYFMSGNFESLQIGGGGGRFALWLDADLYRGASFSCPTFHNAPLSTQEDFIVQDLEVWTVQNCLETFQKTR